MRLIVRRVRDANPTTFMSTSPGRAVPCLAPPRDLHRLPLAHAAAEADHRRHAIVEQVIADLKNGPLAHLPSARLAANAAWLVLAAIAFNLTRAIGALASPMHAKATTATIRTQLINIPSNSCGRPETTTATTRRAV